MKTQKSRKKRIIARGEVSGHAHIVTGNAKTSQENNKLVIDVIGDNCAIKHLLEKPFVEEGREVWTKEHDDIKLKKGKYEYVPQVEYDPYDEVIRRVQD